MSGPPSHKCLHCGQDDLAKNKAYHIDCWSKIKDGIATIPPIYRQLRPITPVRFVNRKPFITILGECGTGKSVAAAELTEHEARASGRIPKWINCAEMMMEIRASFGQRSCETEIGLVRRFTNIELLVIDDLAAERVSEFSITTLYLILNRRGEYSRQTIITSNLALDVVAARLDDRIANRLARYGSVVTLARNNIVSSKGDH